MSRDATIEVWNKTNGEFILKGYLIKHGRFKDGQSPPLSIGAGEKKSFAVELETWSWIGPEGTVYYLTQQDGEQFQVNIHYNHPYSFSSSSYTCYSEPENKITFTLYPSRPVGQDQLVTLTIHNNI